MRTVYLAGPINGCTDEQAHGWRDIATAQLEAGGWTVLNPMRRDYRGRESESVSDIVNGDLADIRLANVVLVNAARPSWGTAMEIVYAHQHAAEVLAFGAGIASPWVAFHAVAVCETLADALAELGP